jgi:hypothetical protein
MDAGNLIYVLIILGVIIFNFIKVRANRVEEVSDYTGSFPETEEKKIPVKKEINDSVVTFQKNQEIQRKKNIKKSPVAQEIDKKSSYSNIEEDKNILFSNPDDARRAFIYSEIWNRKY